MFNDLGYSHLMFVIMSQNSHLVKVENPMYGLDFLIDLFYLKLDPYTSYFNIFIRIYAFGVMFGQRLQTFGAFPYPIVWFKQIPTFEYTRDTLNAKLLFGFLTLLGFFNNRC